MFTIKNLILLQFVHKLYIKFDKVEVTCSMNEQIIEFHLLKPGDASAENKKQPDYKFLKADLTSFSHLWASKVSKP